jgi:hypothetical protein
LRGDGQQNLHRVGLKGVRKAEPESLHPEDSGSFRRDWHGRGAGVENSRRDDGGRLHGAGMEGFRMDDHDGRRAEVEGSRKDGPGWLRRAEEGSRGDDHGCKVELEGFRKDIAESAGGVELDGYRRNIPENMRGIEMQGPREDAFGCLRRAEAVEGPRRSGHQSTDRIEVECFHGDDPGGLRRAGAENSRGRAELEGLCACALPSLPSSAELRSAEKLTMSPC